MATTSLSKNNILMIITVLGGIITVLGGFLSKSLTFAGIMFAVTLFMALIFFFLYQPPAGQACDPDTPDSNVHTWVTSEFGVCQASTCYDKYYIEKDKLGVQRCVIPTAIPTGWTQSALSNVISDTTSNLISTSTTIDNLAACGYDCDDTDGCNVAAFSKAGCSLYTMTPIIDATKPTDTSNPVTMILRPKKS